ncbi:major facilitator superfamily domain-containing protein [Fomitopsis serialis]|uniref:major facilitator superfamily domain-containing protein n=1 Tax=Fomitopsis serialis TaxID=139415 RepID=UPI002007AA80|nr:major facilitator superfamily domain-containing protein [Neoantrodia serialis]KAH9932180.1 major facilitator superfamily domain-containing protein [Neoantrodia serialis]
MSRKVALSAYMAIAASAFGLISDGYHNNLMTMTNLVFRRLYPSEYTSVIGQVIIGILCDRVGRKAGLVLTTLFIVIGATLCTVAHGAHGSAHGLFWFMTFARGITGLGAGGEYPASSTSASEGANEAIAHQRGPVCFGIGIILPLTVFYFRMRMVTSKLYRESAIRRRVPYRLALKRYWKTLIGTAGTYFVYAFATSKIDYPNGVFSATIIANIIKDGDLKKTAEWQLVLGAIALPGVVVGAFLVNPLGRRYTGYVIFGCGYDRITSIMPLLSSSDAGSSYGLMIFMSNLGPGNITLLASAESYPTSISGDGQGRAVVGTQVFIPMQENLGQRWTFIIAAIFGVLGILITYVFVPDMTGVNLAVEDEKFFRYLAENGWQGESVKRMRMHTLLKR